MTISPHATAPSSTRPLDPPYPHEDDDYLALVTAVRGALANLPAGTVLFDTKVLSSPPAPDRYDLFLNQLPAGRRQHYECRHCRYFVNKYGGMVIINAEGRRMSPLWDVGNYTRSTGRPYDPGMFSKAIHAVRSHVEHAPITGVLYRPSRGVHRAPDWLGEQSSWTPKACGGQFNHLCVRLPSGAAGAVGVPTYDRAAAVKEDHDLLARTVGEFAAWATRARDIIASSGAGAGTMAKMAEWFVQVCVSVGAVSASAPRSAPREDRDTHRAALLWRAAANAPTGFCHVKNTLFGTVLEDVRAGVSAPAIFRKLGEKTHPLQYQRPQAAPTAGAIDRAERLFADLGLEKSLERRYATWVELRDGNGGGVVPVVTGPGPRQPRRRLWALAPPPRRGRRGLTVPEQNITWSRFARDVLPLAKGMDYLTPGAWSGAAGKASFFAFVTATYPEAPCLFQWGNHVNWYLYYGGSSPSRWSLPAGAWVPVVGILPSSNMPVAPHIGQGAYFVLEGAKDTAGMAGPGLALFPEELRSDLREVRSVIEAASKAGRITMPTRAIRRPGLRRVLPRENRPGRGPHRAGHHVFGNEGWLPHRQVGSKRLALLPVTRYNPLVASGTPAGATSLPFRLPGKTPASGAGVPRSSRGMGTTPITVLPRRSAFFAR